MLIAHLRGGMLLILAVALIATSCSGGGNGGNGGNNPPANRPPTITNIIIQGGASPLAAGNRVVCIVEASDPDGNPLQYSLTPADGTVMQAAERPSYFVYTSPVVAAPSAVSLAFSVADGQGGTDDMQRTLDIIPPEAGNSPQANFNVIITPNPVAAGQTAQLLCNLLDTDNEPQYFTYVWEGFQGTLTEQASGIADFTAPQFNSTNTIQLDVYADDGHGHFIHTSESITVQPGP